MSWFKRALTAVLLIAWSGSHAGGGFLIIQSTTSTQNSGLFEVILPQFEKASGIEARVVAVGTGQALKNAQNCDGDVVFAHDQAAEAAFVEAGYGLERFEVMANDFVIIGPGADPAGIAGFEDAAMALTAIAEKQLPFVSRGDDSGTHRKERSLWAAAGIDAEAASGTWYREAGSGMGATLNTAVGMEAYVLTDRGTWISFANRRGFEVLVEGDERLFNPYGVIAVSSEHCPKAKIGAASTFIDWITGSEGQAAIGAYEREGQRLFWPTARK